MTDYAAEMKEGLRRLAGSRSVEDNRDTMISRAARKVGLTYYRAYELWYGRARRIDAHELEAVREKLRVESETALKGELADVYVRMARVEAELARLRARRSRRVRDEPGEELDVVG